MFLGAFATLRESLLASSRPSVCLGMEEIASHWTDFYEMWCLIFRISVERIHVWLKSDMNNGYFTRRHMSWMKPPRWTAGNRFFHCQNTERVHSCWIAFDVSLQLSISSPSWSISKAMPGCTGPLILFQCTWRRVTVRIFPSPPRSISSIRALFHSCLGWTSSCRRTTSLTLNLECSASGLLLLVSYEAVEGIHSSSAARRPQWTFFNSKFCWHIITG